MFHFKGSENYGTCRESLNAFGTRSERVQDFVETTIGRTHYTAVIKVFVEYSLVGNCYILDLKTNYDVSFDVT